MQPLATQPTTALALRFPVIMSEMTRHNITMSTIYQLRTDTQHLTINGIDDRKGYKEVRTAKIRCKSLRILTKKICKQGRKDALQEQRAWISKEREITGMLLDIEKPLAEKQRAIDREKEKIRKENERIEAERIQKRINQLAAYGATIDFTLLKTLPDSDFAQMVQHARQMWTQAQEAIKRQREADKAETQRLKDLARLQSQTISEMKKVVAEKVPAPVEVKEEKQLVPAPKNEVYEMWEEVINCVFEGLFPGPDERLSQDELVSQLKEKFTISRIVK